MNSPEALDQLAAYVPMPVAQAIYKDPRPLTGPQTRRFPAVVLFADISGFTPLSEMLGRSGPAGAEELTHLINQYFTRMIRIIESYHGQVVKFSGDAMTALFPAGATPMEAEISAQTAVRRAGECALAMQAKMGFFSDIKTSQGRASLLMKVGIGFGEVLECSIGGALGRWEYVVAGDPIIQISTAEHYAKPGQIVLSQQAWSRVRKFFTGTLVIKHPDYIILDKVLDPLPTVPSVALDWSKLDEVARTEAEKALRCYIPGAIKARLDDQAEWLAELRRITILFIGVGGLDYEDEKAGETLQNFLQGVQEVVYRYEGSLGKVAVDDKGTVLLILFGAPPFFHEDDSKRAVACALSLQTVARERQLRMAIGITEGSIFAGPVGAPTRREYTVIGDDVNLAARLMEYGRGGSIIVNNRVREKVGEQFITEDLGQVALKGKSRSVSAFVVKGEQGVQDEILNRYLLQDDPLVGRKSELEQIRRMAARVRHGKRQLLLMEGELGLGKSRLAAEMVREWMMAGGVGYGSKCMSYGQEIPYQGWREILIAIFGLTLSLSLEEKRDHLLTGLKELPVPEGEAETHWVDRLPLLGDALGLDLADNDLTRLLPPDLRRQNTFDIIREIILRQASRHPLLILFEDVQWSDSFTLDLIADLVRTLLDQQVFIVLLYRPGADLAGVEQVRQLPDTHFMQLEPLSDEESLFLVRMLLDKRSLPDDVEAEILKRGQGNPFFLQEMTGAIVDAIGTHEKLTFDLLEGLDLPETVHDAILAKVDRLSEDEKLTLKIASVIGTNFQRLLLSEVHPMVNAVYQLPAQLSKLEREKLLRLEQPAPKWEYVFRNVIAQEVIYEGLLMAQRQQLHAVVAEALEAQAEEEVEQLAFHYKRADNSTKALHYLKIASQRARREHANHAAIGYYTEILSCLIKLSDNKEQHAVLSPEYWDFLMERARLYNLVGWRDEEVEDLGTLGILAEALDDDYRRAIAAQQWVMLYETSGDYDSGLEVVERFVEQAHKIGDEKLLGQGYNDWGKLLYLRGYYEKADTHLAQALEIAERIQDKEMQAKVRHNEGLVSYYQANYENAQLAFQSAITLWGDLGDQVGWGNSLAQLGQVFYDIGQYGDAQHCYEQSLNLHRAIGDRSGEALARRGLARIYRSLGAFIESRNLFEEALTFYQTVGDRHQEVQCMYDLGFLHNRLGEVDKALMYLEESLVTMKELQAPWWAQVKALIYYSWTLHDADCAEEAQAFITEAFEIERDTQQKISLLEDMMILGRIALTLDDVSMADSCAQQVFYFIEHQGIQGIEHPAMAYLTLYYSFQASGNLEKAQAALAQGKQFVNDLTAQVEDVELRENFLANIPEARELLAIPEMVGSGL